MEIGDDLTDFEFIREIDSTLATNFAARKNSSNLEFLLDVVRNNITTVFSL